MQGLDCRHCLLTLEQDCYLSHSRALEQRPTGPFSFLFRAYTTVVSTVKVSCSFQLFNVRIFTHLAPNIPVYLPIFPNSQSLYHSQSIYVTRLFSRRTIEHIIPSIPVVLGWSLWHTLSHNLPVNRTNFHPLRTLTCGILVADFWMVAEDCNSWCACNTRLFPFPRF